LSLLKYRLTSPGVAFDSVTPLPISGNAGDVSPDGTLIAYADGAQSYRTYRLSDGAKTLITTLPTGSHLGLITFTRDGSGVVYSVHIGDTAVTNLYRAQLSGGDPVDLGISGVITEFATAPDDSIFTSRQRNSTTDFVIEDWAASGGSAAYVTGGNRPSLSCSGTQLMFQTNASTAPAIGVLRRDLSTGLQYTFAPSGYYAPEYLGC
jgi:Tol biopolymer transport system component